MFFKNLKNNFWLLFFIISSLFLILGFFRSQRIVISAFDSGLYLQLLHNFLSLDLSSSITGEYNFLSHHFQPVVLLFAPISFLGPTGLFLLSFLVIIICTKILVKNFKSEFVYAASILLLVQPSVAGQLYYGFSADVLSMPAFLWMAVQLEKEDCSKNIFKWALAFLWAGLCKENFWIINSAIALAAFFKFDKNRFFILLSAIFLAIFCFLFFYWMPSHSTYDHYYGFNYYFNGSFSIRGLLSNIFSTGSLKVLLNLVWMTGFLGFLSLRLIFIPLFTGLSFILFSFSPQIHHPANQYLLCVLPFIIVAFIKNTEAIKRNNNRFIAPLIVLPFLYTIFFDGGPLTCVQKIIQNPRTRYFKEDLYKIRSIIPKDKKIIVDGIFQPVFFDYKNVSILLSFVGNPKKLSNEELLEQDYIITSEDFSKIKDCSKVFVGGESLKVNYKYFIKICKFIKKYKIIWKGNRSRIIVYRISS